MTDPPPEEKEGKQTYGSFRMDTREDLEFLFWFSYASGEKSFEATLRRSEEAAEVRGRRKAESTEFFLSAF